MNTSALPNTHVRTLRQLAQRSYLIRQRFGNLVVIGVAGTRNNPDNRHLLWPCRCDCGRELFVYAHSLQSGNTTSCGCGSHAADPMTRARNSYSNAQQRCGNPNHPRFADYGGRGITFEFDDFNAFVREVGLPPTGKTLERIDNDRGYTSGNVRWATYLEQAANKRPRRAA